jgi:hypothetical protein
MPHVASSTTSPRAGEIGPVRREIIFEPLTEPSPAQPAPSVPASPEPEHQPETPAEPVPSAP